jgi:enterochelin esterase-like enzyme
VIDDAAAFPDVPALPTRARSLTYRACAPPRFETPTFCSRSASRRRRSTREPFCAGLLLPLALLTACSTSQEHRPSTNTGQAGSTATAGTGAAGAVGAAGAGEAGTSGGAGASGSAGVAGTGAAGDGAAGVAGTGAAGSGAAGTGGASGGGGAAGAVDAGTMAAGAKVGTQAPPGTTGDGTFPLPGPYNLPPESMTLMNGAKMGQTLGPFKHTQTGTYTNWMQWVFTYYVFVPAEYQAGHAAALMVFNDGYLYAGINSITDVRFNAPYVIENLIKEGSMPVTIGVFIFPGTNDGHQVGGGDSGRGIQYDTANDQYGKFLREEFLPTEILSKYDIVTDPDGWAMAGHSSGGIGSIIAGWFHSDRWHKMLTASASFPNKGGMFPALFNTAPAKPLRIYQVSGTMDNNGYYAANTMAANILQMLGYHDRFRTTTDVHYPPKAAMTDFADAMRWLWRGYKTPP